MKVPTDSAKVGSVGLIEGWATYYCYPGQNRITASGLPFKEDQMTCAFYLGVSEEVEKHETLKERNARKRKYLGRYLLITSQDTTIKVLCTDNGSYMEYPYRDRHIVADLTPSLYKALGGLKSKGKIKVKIKIL